MNYVKVGNARLEKLAAFLDNLPRKRFSYNRWVGPNWGGAQDLSCGTTACALGWATTMKPFRRLGLRLVGPSCDATPQIADLPTIASAQKLFYLSPSQVEHLFIPPEGEFSATPKYVARKIRKFIRSRAIGGA